MGGGTFDLVGQMAQRGFLDFVVEHNTAVDFVFMTHCTSSFGVGDGPLIAPTTVTTQVGNHPNPFNPATTVSFTLASPSSVSLEVYDAPACSLGPRCCH